MLKPKVIVIILVVGIIVLLFSSFFLIKNNSECTLNPLVYGAKKIKESTGPLLCTCEFDDDRYDDIIFDEEEMVVKEKDRGQFIPDFNFKIK